LLYDIEGVFGRTPFFIVTLYKQTNMKKLILFLSLWLVVLSLPGQDAPPDTGRVYLISPVEVGPEISARQMQSAARLQTYRNWGIMALHFDTLLQSYSGAGQRVCICDTGKPDHPDLIKNIQGAANFSTDNTANDLHGHSTHVAGIVHEIAPDAGLYFAKVLNASGSGSNTGVANGIRWCTEQGAKIISLSLGSPVGSSTLLSAIVDATNSGALVICAAGNSGSGDRDNIDYPGKYGQTIAVGAIDEDLETALFSSSGPEGDIMAPGVHILSTWLGGNYISLSGTSMATPFVSGIAAIWDEKNGTGEVFREKIRATGKDIAPPGFDRFSFWGIATPAAFAEEQPGPGPGPEPMPDPVKGWFEKFWWLFVVGLVLIGAVWFFISKGK